MYLYIYIYIYIHIHTLVVPNANDNNKPNNTLGVSTVLAYFVEFEHGLYKSCGIECVEGIMLEPCLLQPCFHVAGYSKP